MIPRDIAVVLARVVDGLGDRSDEFVFVGGAVVGILVTDPTAPPPRPTVDVDVTIDIATHLQLDDLRSDLRANGFKEDPSGPICRWRLDDIVVDVMPANEPNPLGFTNRWYASALTSAQTFEVLPGRRLRVISAPHFLATKLEAFDGRGDGDFVASHDLEDVIAVIDGRPTIVSEFEASFDGAAAFVRTRVSELMKDEEFRDAILGHLPGDGASQRRAPIILERLRKIGGVV
jgi:predicted nucleotidyltransferase